MTLDDMAGGSGSGAAKKPIWLGWSLGGLVASQIALRHPERVQALITVASSPCFSAREAWPGIKPEVLAGFQHQLSEDFSGRWSVSWHYRRWEQKPPVRMRGR